MTGAEVVAWQSGIEAVDRAVLWWKTNPQLPAAYIDKRTGEIDLRGMALAGRALWRLDLDVEAWLGDTYVVHSGEQMTLGFKADAQRALASRAGYDVMIDEVDDQHVVAHMETPRGPTPKLIKRITDTDLVNYAKTNKRNYDDKPNRMLEARVSTELVDLYAKRVLREIVVPVAGELGAGFTTDSGPPAIGEGRPGPETRDDGTTIPAALRQPVCPEDLRTNLITRLAALELAAPDRVAELREQLAPAKIPNLRATDPSRRSEFRMAHGWLLDRIFADLEDELAAAAAARAQGADAETGALE